MGIFDKLLRSIGFEDEDQEKIEEKTIEKKKEKKININSKFDLKNLEEENQLEERMVETYNPKDQTEIEEIANKLKNGESTVINFFQFSETDRIRALDFLSGVIFILNGKIEKVDKTTYLFNCKKND